MPSRRHRRSPEAGPLDDDDLLCEILLRLPPQPSSLPRASLVCKRWRRLVSDRGFSRRFRRHHRRSAPLLSFFDRHSLSFIPTLDAPNRVPPGRFSLPRGDGDRFLSLGCRHGLVLIFDISRTKILVWNPLTGDQDRLDIPPGLAIHAKKTIINVAVLRAGDLQHFQVVLTVTGSAGKQLGRVLACVYSSETGVWGDLITTRLPSEVPASDSFPPTLVNTGMPAVLAGGSLYWMLVGKFVGVLEFDLQNQSLTVIRVPVHMLKEGHYAFSIMRAEGGGLGLLFQTGDHNLEFWKRKIDRDGVASWGLGRSIEPDKLLSLDSRGLAILGLAEENNVAFLWTSGVVFMVNLESLQFKKLFETSFLTPYHPFESVYTPGNNMPTHISCNH